MRKWTAIDASQRAAERSACILTMLRTLTRLVLVFCTPILGSAQRQRGTRRSVRPVEKRPTIYLGSQSWGLAIGRNHSQSPPAVLANRSAKTYTSTSSMLFGCACAITLVVSFRDVKRQFSTKGGPTMPEFPGWAEPEIYIARGYIDVKDNAHFRVASDTASCFGRHCTFLGRAFIWHPMESEKTIWFPKLYENDNWDNRISADGRTITEISRSPALARRHIDKHLIPSHKLGKNRIVLGHIYRQGYGFEGEFELDKEGTNYDWGCVWRRVSERARTYPPA
jgi:SET and RING associated domain